LFSLPQTATVALLLRGETNPDAGGFGDSLGKLFGDRLGTRDHRKLSQAFDDFSRAHHGATVVGLVRTPHPSLLLNFEVSDAKAFSQAWAELTALLEVPLIDSWAAGTVGKPSVARLPANADGSERVRIRFQRARPQPGLPATVNVVWRASDGIGSVLISADEATGPGELAAGPRLAELPWLSQVRPGGAEQTALGLFLNAQWFAPAGTDDAPLLLTFGKKEQSIELELDLSPGALSAVTRVFALDR
jgi:hypothetical protein